MFVEISIDLLMCSLRTSDTHVSFFSVLFVYLMCTRSHHRDSLQTLAQQAVRQTVNISSGMSTQAGAQNFRLVPDIYQLYEGAETLAKRTARNASDASTTQAYVFLSFFFAFLF